MVRPTAGHSTLGLIQLARYRYRGVRWIVAIGAAAAAFLALNYNSSEPASNILPNSAQTLNEEKLAARLPATTRGVSIPTTSEIFMPGDYVDVHEISTGKIVVSNALLVEVTSEDTVVAIPTGQVDAVVDAVTTGGIMLVLVPRSAL